MSRPRLDCPPDLVPLLGVLPDPMIADQAHVSTATVRRWRDEREIPPCRERGAPRSAMTAATTRKCLDALRERLGGLSWAHLAARCGVSRQAMHAARRDGASVATLRAWEQRAMVSTVEHRGPLVYTMPDGVAPLLGIETDTEISRRYGVPRQVVARWRVAHGKPPPARVSSGTAALPLGIVRVRLAALRMRHGVSTWRELADALGVGRQSVSSARIRSVTAATLERWESVPVRTGESDGA